MACRSVLSSPYVGYPCASPCSVPCPPPCALPCPPLVGPTGATGPRGSSLNADEPTVILSAALNAPVLALTALVAAQIPFNLVIDSNVAGAASFNTSSGVFTVLIPGIYKVDFGIAFSSLTGIAAGLGITVAVRQNLTSLTTSTFSYPAGTLATNSNNINGHFVGQFGVGDAITLTALASFAASVLGPTISGVAPYNSTFTVRSLF